ncbi:MAG: hypothetical protein RQ741_02545 [Wenzhouxiangellaceae bacterium]|nr:hypothetical protein [Wenzhouxiangellaceae bacterium]
MDKLVQAGSLMESFAPRTGLVGARSPSRYLWTDAFAVCNFLGLYLRSDRRSHLELALSLVEQVHDTLGAYAPSDSRSGWLGGQDDRDHRLRPTRFGLRIGKKMIERGPSEPFDERLEWERDGQYFHYLTRWMHALEQVARVTAERRYHQWAVELFLAAHSGFVYRGGPGRCMPRMHWKMSVDLSRPLVESMGQHDPLDGWISGLQLRESRFASEDERVALADPIDEFLEMCAARSWTTGDPLGIGGLLTDAWRLDRLLPVAEDVTESRIMGLLRDAAMGLAWQVEGGHLEGPASARLAFRELGLSIGLHALQRMRQTETRNSGPDEPGMLEAFEAAARFSPLAERIEAFWLDPSSQRAPGWNDHLDINSVMLATCLVPDGYLLGGQTDT